MPWAGGRDTVGASDRCVTHLISTPIGARFGVMDPPTRLDLKKDRGLAIEWSDGTSDYYSIAYLRRMSPSAEARELRTQMERNPLTVLPSNRGADGPLVALAAELVGNYAIRIRFSDGHDTGIYSWDYLREIAPPRPAEG